MEVRMSGQDQTHTGGYDNRPEKDVVSDVLSDEDKRVLRNWRDSLTLQDPRYHSKGILQVAQRAMSDEEFRTRLLNDTQALLRELQPKALPPGVTLMFLENTRNALV